MTYIIGIAGGSASGKSELAQHLKTEFKDAAVVISLDNFYRKKTDKPANLSFDDPEALEWEIIVNMGIKLRRGEAVTIPQYDFTVSDRTEQTLTIQPHQIVIIEGLWALNSKIRHLLDEKIYVDAYEDTRFQRRLTRDINERGRTEASIREVWSEVEIHFNLFVEPQKQIVDVTIIDNNANDIPISSNPTLSPIIGKIKLKAASLAKLAANLADPIKPHLKPGFFRCLSNHGRKSLDLEVLANAIWLYAVNSASAIECFTHLALWAHIYQKNVGVDKVTELLEKKYRLKIS
jgi:uridine kinase